MPHDTITNGQFVTNTINKFLMETDDGPQDLALRCLIEEAAKRLAAIRGDAYVAESVRLALDSFETVK